MRPVSLSVRTVSVDGSRDTLSMPDPFFASSSHAPVDERGCLESHSSQSEVDTNAKTGKPTLVSIRDIGWAKLAFYCVATTFESTWNLR